MLEIHGGLGDAGDEIYFCIMAKDKNNPPKQTPPQQPSQKKPQSDTRKRLRPEESSSEEDNSSSDTWPRFLILKDSTTEKTLSRLSPFVVSKTIKALAGEPKSVKRLRDGSLLVEVLRKSHSDSLLKLTLFSDVPVSVTPHRSLNTKKGVIRCREFDSMDENNILEELSSQGVVHVRRITSFRNGIKQNTQTYILTFGTPVLPAVLIAGYLRLRVDLYIPNPLRCFKCQRFGHHKDNCRNKQVCPKCGVEGHVDTDCTNDSFKCQNCNGPHSSNSKDCPVWHREKSIVKLKTEQNISFPDARKILEDRTGPVTQQKSYAQAATKPIPLPKVSVRSFSTQTDLTWPTGQPMFATLPSQIKSKTTDASTETVLAVVEVHQPLTQSSVTKEKSKLKIGPKSFQDKTKKKSSKHLSKQEKKAASRRLPGVNTVCSPNRFQVLSGDEEEQGIEVQASDSDFSDPEVMDQQSTDPPSPPDPPETSSS